MLKIIDFLYFCMNVIASQGKKRISLEDTKWSFAYLVCLIILPLGLTVSKVFPIKSDNTGLIIEALLGILSYLIAFKIAKKYYSKPGVRDINIDKLYKKYKLNRYFLIFIFMIIWSFYLVFCIKMSKVIV